MNINLEQQKQSTQSNEIIPAVLEEPLLNSSLNFIEVCAGGGGLSCGLIQSGFTPILLNDNNKDCCSTLKKNHPNANIILGSMVDIDYTPYIDKVDLLTGGIPCFIAGTKVLTDYGYKNIENVHLRNLLLTHTGKLQPIINLQRKIYTGKLFEISIFNHKTAIVCTPEHPFYVREKTDWGFNEPVWVSAKDITEKHFFGMIQTNCLINKNNDDNTAENMFEVEFDINEIEEKYVLNETMLILTSFNQFNQKKHFTDEKHIWFAPTSIIQKDIVEIPVYNFEVETDNSYIVENTIVHNCQSFSQSGLRKGLQDPRGDLMLQFIRIIHMVKPKVFMIENVKGLLSHDKGNTLKQIVTLLNNNTAENIAEGLYDISYKCLDASKYGVPQKRERVFIVGVLKSLNKPPFVFPAECPTKKVLKDVLVNVPPSNGLNYSAVKCELFKQIPQGGCWINLPEELQKSYLGNSFYSGGGKRGILYRLSMEKPSLTLLCTPSQKQTERCHPLEERPLTIREYARIQTFDDEYVFSGSMNSQYKQIGNAVPVELSKYMAVSIRDFLMMGCFVVK